MGLFQIGWIKLFEQIEVSIDRLYGMSSQRLDAINHALRFVYIIIFAHICRSILWELLPKKRGWLDAPVL